MRFSVVMPVHNRSNLLHYGLKSIRNNDFDQEEVEIIVVDALSNDGNYAREVCQQWDAHYIKIDPYKSDLEVPREGHINPCLQQNVGIKMSSGEIIVLTSPEVVFASEVLSRFDDCMRPKTSLYGMVFEPDWEEEVKNADTNDWTTNVFRNIPHNIPYNFDSQGHNKLSAYFLGAFWFTDIMDIGGIDEQYIRGIAWEDEDFGLRIANIATPGYREDIIGIHLPHSRAYQVQDRINLNEEIMRQKGFMDVPRWMNDHAKVTNIKANEGRVWGDYKKLISEVSATIPNDRLLTIKSIT